MGSNESVQRVILQKNVELGKAVGGSVTENAVKQIQYLTAPLWPNLSFQCLLYNVVL